MSLSPDATVVVSQNVAVADLGSEAVLLDPTSGTYFGLNEVAARILDLAQETITIDSIVDRLLDEFDVDRNRLFGDVTAFVGDLERRGLITVQ